MHGISFIIKQTCLQILAQTFASSMILHISLKESESQFPSIKWDPVLSIISFKQDHIYNILSTVFGTDEVSSKY